MSFPEAPGGDRYEWKAVETIFNITERGFFVITIKASAKNAKQNRSKDDDDLRIALDGFDFGKYERHKEMISWKGFGTSASWDGASLKGGTKAIYFFVELEQGIHTLQFFADETPALESIEIFEIKNNVFELADLKPQEKIKSQRNGIPWFSFVFLGSHTKTFMLGVNTQSSETKRSTDGDNLKVILNGEILQNPVAPKSSKYKNFYFSGYVKEFDILTITHENLSHPFAFENAIELWYDEQPEIVSLKINYFDHEEFLERLKKLVDLRKYVEERAHGAVYFFRKTGNPYSAQFLEHSLKANPSPLVFNSSHPLVKKIKADSTYGKVIEKLKEKIMGGCLEGEVWPEDFVDDSSMRGKINFDSHDLKTALHGIHKIEYKAKPLKNNQFLIEFVLFDIYDFEKQNVPFLFTDIKKYFENTTINRLNLGEDLGLVRNFEIKICLTETLYVGHTIPS